MVWPQTIAGVRLAYKFLVNPQASVTAGSFRNLTVTVPERSVFDARLPAACQYYYPHIGLMIDLFMRAMSEPAPHLTVAGQPADAMNIMFTGDHPSTGELFVSGEATGVGWGAYDGGDGSNGMITFGGGDLKNFPVEVQEHRYPLRIHEYALRNDSGGRGRWRGGLGIVRDYEVLTDCRLSTWFERTRTPGGGLFGADAGGSRRSPSTKPAELGRAQVRRCACCRGYASTCRNRRWRRIRTRHERDASAIEQDLIDGYITNWPDPPRQAT